METLDSEIDCLKAAFGVELARSQVLTPGASAFQVAKTMGLPTELCVVAQGWVVDPITVDARARELEVFLPPVPSKEELITRILAVANGRGTEAKDALAGFKLIGEMLEYIPKAPPTQINNHLGDNVLNSVRNVVAIPELTENWEEELREQQARSIEEAIEKPANVSTH